MENILEVEHLTKRYKGFKLDRISFALPKGSIMGLIGENGAGKTTIIKLLLGVVDKDGGNISIFGMDPLKYEKIVKSRIGLVYDDICFYDEFKAKDIDKIMAGFFPKLWKKQQFYELLTRFSLPVDKKIKEFSRGMKTKFSIAVALAHEPELLVLDEPTSGLDPVARAEMMDIFLEFIQNENHSILVSSHITSDLEKVADYITYIHNGKLIFSDSKDDILNNYGILKCGSDELAAIDAADIIGMRQSSFGCEILVKDREQMAKKYDGAVIDGVSLDEIMVFQNRGEQK